MGEAKRRKAIDTNYGKPKAIVQSNTVTKEVLTGEQVWESVCSKVTEFINSCTQPGVIWIEYIIDYSVQSKEVKELLNQVISSLKSGRKFHRGSKKLDISQVLGKGYIEDIALNIEPLEAVKKSFDEAMEDEDFPPDQEMADSIILCEQCDFSTHRVVRMVNEPGAPPKIWVPDELLTFVRNQIISG